MSRLRLTIRVVANAVPLLAALALIWWPEVSLYWVGPTSVPVAAVESARSQPDRPLLHEIGTQSLLPLVDKQTRETPAKLRELGDGVLAGRVAFVGQPVATAPFPFRASHLDLGLPGHQLQFASLGTLWLLLEAHAASGDWKYAAAALREVEAFDQIDAWRLVPRGLLWNDHALASRVAPLVRLWSQVRDRPDLPVDSAHTILQLADRTGARLAKDSLFNARTNHGIMQSIALMQLGISFPTLPRAAWYLETGKERLRMQFKYYMDADGPVLEHSAGYHELGRELLSMAIRAFELSGSSVPPDWPQLLRKAGLFTSAIARPDGTLPTFGNTDHAPAVHEARQRPPSGGLLLYRTAGYAVRWRGLDSWPATDGLRQSVVTWSNFPSGAHKLADDMSLLLWVGGWNLITNSGYWPYGLGGFDEANSWRGSNAPHFVGEPAKTLRRLELLGAAGTEDLTVLDLQRTMRDGSAVRRQIVELRGGAWLVVDSAASAEADREVERLWTVDAGSHVESIDGRNLLVTRDDASARIAFAGEISRAPTLRAGSVQPFAGWVVHSSKPRPAPSIEVRQRANRGLLVSVITVGPEASSPTLAPGADADRWRVQFIHNGAPISVTRDGPAIAVAGAIQANLRVERPIAEAARRARIVAAYEQARNRFPGVRDLSYYRMRVTKIALLLALAQGVVLAVAWRWRPRVVRPLSITAALCWIAFGLLASRWYLQ